MGSLYATSKSDFNPANFKKEKATLYVGLEPTDINRLKPLMKFFYQHMLQGLCHHDETAKHGVLFLLDDFPSIGKMDLVTSCVSYARGYKIKLAMTIQNLADLKSAYCEKGANAIINNTNFKIAYTTNSSDTREFLGNLSPDISMKEVTKL